MPCDRIESNAACEVIDWLSNPIDVHRLDPWLPGFRALKQSAVSQVRGFGADQALRLPVNDVRRVEWAIRVYEEFKAVLAAA